MRAVCAIIDAFHFVPPGTRLDTAPLLSTDKLSLAEKVAKAGSGDRGEDQEQQKNPKMGLEHPTSGSTAEVSGDPLDADCAPKEAVNPSEEADAWNTTPAEEEQAAEAQVQEDAEVEEGGRGLSDDEGRGAKRLAATAADIQRAIVLRVLPSMLNLMHKVRSLLLLCSYLGPAELPVRLLGQDCSGQKRVHGELAFAWEFVTHR